MVSTRLKMADVEKGVILKVNTKGKCLRVSTSHLPQIHTHIQMRVIVLLFLQKKSTYFTIRCSSCYQWVLLRGVLQSSQSNKINPYVSQSLPFINGEQTGNVITCSNFTGGNHTHLLISEMNNCDDYASVVSGKIIRGHYFRSNIFLKYRQ